MWIVFAEGDVDFRILGPLEAVDGPRPVDLTRGKRKALLALLLLHADRVVPRGRLVDDLWGEEVPESAPKMVQIFVSQLRKQLPPKLIQTYSAGYRVDLEGHSLDLRTFESLQGVGRDALANGRAQEAARTLRRALELWRGTPLAEFEEPFARLEEARLVELQLTCLEECLDAELTLGSHAALVAELDGLVRRHPFRERLRGQLMLALYRSGRHAEALQAFQSFRTKLQDELGIDPPQRLKELERLVLQQDASLDLVTREPAPDPDLPPSVAVPTSPLLDDMRDLQRAVLSHDPALDLPDVAAPASSRREVAELRKTVTVLVADVAEEDAPDDPEARRAAALERTRAVEQELDRHGASVVALGGGRVLGVFGVPTAQDDDSLRAVTAAVALRSSGLARRVGLSTGEVVTGDPFVSGAPVDEAVQLQERAATGDVLAAGRTWRMVRHAAAASSRDDAWAIDTVDPAAAPLLRRLETPLVGRDRELGEIAEAFERAAAEGRPHLVTVFGAPGVGKTRLAIECVERLRGWTIPALGQCRAGAQEETYAPLRDVVTALADGEAAAWVRERLGSGDGAQLAEQLVAAVGLTTGAAHTEDTALAARRLFAGLAREHPLLVVLEDVHWASPALLDLVETLVELARDPVLVLCLARPDLLDLRPHWGGGRLQSSVILLDALTPVESETLLDRLSASEGLDAAARERILAVAEGNPLFIEQLIAAALEADSDALPDSIQTLLAARLDRLDERDRAAVEAAAVCGTSFTEEDVSTLVDGDHAASLVALDRRELIRPGTAGDPGHHGWSFRHSLIRDVAYASIPKRRRAELHERLAARAIGQGTEGDVQAGIHLDRAVRARRETGERGPGVDRLAAQAAEHLQRAGLGALEREDMAAAASLLRRASELLPNDAPERVKLLPKLGEALSFLGEPDAAREVLAEAHAAATELGDARLAAQARVATLALMWGAEAGSPELVLRDLEEAMPILEGAGDHEALAMAEVARFHALDRGRLPDPVERLSVALDHARRAGANQIEHHVMGWICITLPRGTTPVGAAIARLEEIAEGTSSSYVHASVNGALGLLRAERGEFEEARTLVEETRRMLEELGMRQAAAAHSIAIGEVEMMAGDEATAERVLRDGFDAVTILQDNNAAANMAWRLGIMLARQGRDDEAEQFARLAQHGEGTGFWVDVWWRVVLAVVEAHRGDAKGARRLVAEARGRMDSVPESGMHADVLLESAEALRVAGREGEAGELITEAAGIAGRLGYVVALRRAEEAQRALTS